MRTTCFNANFEQRIVRSGRIMLGVTGVFFLLCLTAEFKNMADFSRIMEPAFTSGNMKFYISTWLEYGIRRSLSFIPRILVGISNAFLGYSIIRKKNHIWIMAMGWVVCASFFFIGEFLFGVIIGSVYCYCNVIVVWNRFHTDNVKHMQDNDKQIPTHNGD